MTAWRTIFPSAAVLFTVMVAHALLETARDALLLTRVGLGGLAWAYLVIAAVSLFAVAAARRWGGVDDPRRMLIRFLGAAVAGTTILAIVLPLVPSLALVLYVWTGVVATLVVPCFWTLIDRSARVIEAKRVFGGIAAGGGLGAMIGSALASGLGRLMPAQYLVTAGAIAFAVAMAATMVLAPRDLVQEVPRRRRAIPQMRGPRRYIKLLVALALISTIALTLGDLVFKRVVADELPPEDLATTFGAIYAVLALFGLVVQLFVAPRLLARWGVGAGLALLPAILLLSAGGFVVTGAFAAIVILKLGDGTLRHSLHRVSNEILFLPIPARLRDRWKPVADAIGQRGGQAIAALLAFVFVAMHAPPRALAFAVGAASVAWLVTISFARRAYLRQFEEVLSAGEILRDGHVPDLDSDSAKLLTDMLSSPDEVEATIALELLARRGSVPALVLYHPRPEVVRRALDLMDGELPPAYARVLAHLMEHADPRIRAAALVTASRTNSNPELLKKALSDEQPDVHAAALVATSATPDALSQLVTGTMVTHLAIARAIGLAPRKQFRTVIYQLLATRDPHVLREMLHVLARVPSLADFPKLLPLLEDPYARADVRRVFTACGTAALEFLIASLDDPRTPAGVQRHVPRSISRFGSHRAAAALAQRLLREPDGTTEFKILRALGRMSINDPSLRIDPAVLRVYIGRAITDAARYTVLGEQLAMTSDSTTPGSQLLAEILVEKQRFAIEHAFRALGILYPRSNMRGIHDGLTRRDEGRRSAAREVFESLVAANLRQPLLVLLSDLTLDERRKQLGDLAPGPFPTFESLLAALLGDPSVSLKCLAAYHAAERNLVSLRPEIARQRPLTNTPLVARAFDQAMERLHA